MFLLLSFQLIFGNYFRSHFAAVTNNFISSNKFLFCCRWYKLYVAPSCPFPPLASRMVERFGGDCIAYIAYKPKWSRCCNIFHIYSRAAFSCWFGMPFAAIWLLLVFSNCCCRHCHCIKLNYTLLRSFPFLPMRLDGYMAMWLHFSFSFHINRISRITFIFLFSAVIFISFQCRFMTSFFPFPIKQLYNAN